MKTITKNLIVLSFLITNVIGWAQTNPTAFNLATSGNYSFTNWPASSPAGTYPANMVFHHFSAMSAPLSTATAASDITGVYNSTSTTQTRMNGLDAGGFSFKNNNLTTDISGYVRRRLGEAVLAINTTDRTNVQVSWVAGEIGTATNIVHAITCQYRIGTSGAYTTLPGSAQYLSSDPSASVSFGPITLPSSCDDQAVVQIRWAYTYVSGTASNPAPQLFVDNISVTSIPLVTISSIPNTCLIDPPFTLSDGLPAGGVYSGTGVSGGMFYPQTAGTGNHTITYTYTDGNGISNFTTTTVDVSMSHCIVESQLNATSCGATGLALNSWIYCDGVYGATSYEFTVANSSLGYSASYIVNAPYKGLSLNKFPGLLNGTTYNVTVKVLHTGVWSGAGAVCQITTAASPTTSLTTASCGATNLTRGSYIYCNGVPGATSYEWTFSNTSLGFNYVYTVPGPYKSVQLVRIPGLVAGETYNVGVKATVGGVQTPAGATCSISLSSSYLSPFETDYKNMEMETTQSAVVYPNPVSLNGEIKIQLNQVQTSTISITDVMGRIVFQRQYSDLDLISININELGVSTGIYNIAISNGESIENNKIVITK
ncbi:MAG: T9SS type A sorting domain-containing protein [Bacteroidetes bacterium]|nr:T9SS type A sorting domain-containing protein [Bacteroidota bacterium]